MGRFGLAINVVALLYGLFVLAFIVIPSVPNPTLQGMNWVGAMGPSEEAWLIYDRPR